MKTEKFVWVALMALILLTFGAMIFMAPAFPNKVLALFMCIVFGVVLVITIKD